MPSDSNNSVPPRNTAAVSHHTASQPSATRVFEEPHYTVSEIAEMWNLSVDVVRRLFQHEPEVLVLGNTNPRVKRRYLTLRIPQSVLERVHRQM